MASKRKGVRRPNKKRSVEDQTQKLVEWVKNADPPCYPVWDYLLAAQQISRRPPPRPGLGRIPPEVWFDTLCLLPIKFRFADGGEWTRRVHDMAVEQGKTTLDVVEELSRARDDGSISWDEATECHVFAFASTELSDDEPEAASKHPRDVFPSLIEALDQASETGSEPSLVKMFEGDDVLRKLLTMRMARELRDDGWWPVKASKAYTTHKPESMYSCMNCMRAVRLEPEPKPSVNEAPEEVRFINGIWTHADDQYEGEHKTDCVFDAEDVFKGLVIVAGEKLERRSENWSLKVSSEFAESALPPQGQDSSQAPVAVSEEDRHFLHLPSMLDALLVFYGLDRSNLFTVDIGGSEFKWHEFFYGLGDIPTLARELAKDSLPRPNLSVKLARPVVMEVDSWYREPPLRPVTRHGVDYWGVYQKVATRVPVSMFGKASRDRERWEECDIWATLRFTDQELAEKVDFTSYPLVVFGYPELGFGKDGTAYLNVVINHAGQIGESFSDLLPRREEPYTAWQA